MRVACGVALVVTHRQRVLFGKRPAKSTAWEWQLPGGWIRPGETPREAARRELREETGLGVGELVFVGVTSNRFAPGEHSISLYFEAACERPDTLRLAEDGKCVAWEWHRWESIGDGLFLPLRLLRETGYRPFLRRPDSAYVSV